ncbi:MAG: c-type cytochrome [Candidatus Acidiferrales bacterium]
MRPLGIVGLIVGLVALLIGLGYGVVNWSEAARAGKLKNPVPVTPKALTDGKQLYQLHCQTCHGANGDGHGQKAPELSAAPGNFTNVSKMRRVSDGELYWQITYGRLPMPAFKDKIKEQGRWELVDYIRTFASAPSHANPAPDGDLTPQNDN